MCRLNFPEGFDLDDLKILFFQNQKRSKLNEITTIVLLCRDQLKITTDRIMNQQSQQPTATGAGAQSTSVPSQSVDFASPRPAGKISRFQELSIRLLNNKFRGLSPSGGCA